MGRIISNFFMSLDGVVESPDQWHFPYFDDEMGAIIGQGAETTDAFLMGRVLYGEWSEFWPQQGDDVPFAALFNNMPKYVVSQTLTEASWNNTTVVSGDVESKLRQLKADTPRDITISGSATLVRSLLVAGLVDELALLVHPIAVGKGRRLFEDAPTIPLKLTSSQTLGSGVLHLTYAPADQ